MFLKNVWYIAAWSSEVPVEGIFKRKLLGEDVIFYRQSNGNVVGMADYCPHRFAPLSLGRHEGDNLRCMYHGLVFDGTGKCIEAPFSDCPPEKVRAKVYPTIERDRYIWIWMGDEIKADTDLIPSLKRMNDKNWHYIPRHLVYKCNFQLLMDNLLDASHLAFVHANSIGGGQYHAEQLPQLETFDWGVRVTKKFEDVPIPPFVKNIAKFKGNSDRWQIFDWRISGNQLIINSGQAPTGTGALEGNYVDEAFHFYSVQTITPETERSTHYFFMFAHSFSEDQVGIAVEIDQQFAVVLQEDRVMLEAQQANLEAFPDHSMAGIKSDRAVAKARMLLEERMKEEARENAA
jgi:phenylpropionate dioxygenase-like ring-hydroxylating dioxygenase large terminal subunit